MEANFRYAQGYTLAGGKRFASRLTPQEEEIIRVSFDSFSEESLDAKGASVRYIDREKLREAFSAIDASGDMHDIQLLIDDIDENGDNMIDWDEWRHIMSRKFLGEEDDSSFGHVFAMLDDNKDGYIPLVEFRKMLMQEGQVPLSEQEVDELLMFADHDSDGLINYRSFLLWLSNPEAFHKEKDVQQNRIAAYNQKGGGKGDSKGNPTLGPASTASPPTQSKGGGKGSDSGAGVGNLGNSAADVNKKLGEMKTQLGGLGIPYDNVKAKQCLEKAGNDVHKAIDLYMP